MTTDNTIHEIVIANMIRLREARGWKKSDLARHTEIDASHLSNIENGKKHMGLEILARVAEALDVEPYELLRPYDMNEVGLGEKLRMIEDLPEIKKLAIEQMLNAFLREKGMEG